MLGLQKGTSSDAELVAHHCAGLETFGIKLAEASKLFGKKFASGASITKNPMEKDQIEVRGYHAEGTPACMAFRWVTWPAKHGQSVD